MPQKPAEAQGWIWDQTFPTNLVALNSNKRNNVFYVGQPVTFALNGTSASRYEVRDYWGKVVDQGLVGATIAPKVKLPGWYKLYLHGSPTPATYGDSVGGTTFVIFRNKPGFPILPSPTAAGSAYSYSGDEIMRGITSIGPQRHYVQDAGQPDQAIAALESDIALDEQYYLPFDPARNRRLLIAFPNGTQDLDGVKKIVAHFKNRVMYWEPRNEPNGGSNGTDFVNNELIPFYQAVKSASPTAKVLGPGVVNVGPGMLGWIEDFLKAGGANYIDGFSFHVYNNINGDFALARTSLDNLNALLAKYGADKIEKWQTEQGYFAAYYGVYTPRHQGRWTMTQMMAFEQYGIPKERNVLWYDRSHGFWDVPCWTENVDGGLNPAGALMRVWSEELQATSFVKALDMGQTGDKQYMGSLFAGDTKKVVVFMSAGGTDGQVTLNATGSSIHVVSAFGVEQDLPVKRIMLPVVGVAANNGQVTLPVSELPVYVEAAPGQTIEVAPIVWGPNLALQPGVKVIASGPGTDLVGVSTDNNLAKLVNDRLENWYYAQGADDHAWMSNVSSFPATVEVDLPSKQTVSRVAIYCPVPWQFDGSLLDYDLQYDNNGQWVTVGSAKEPTNTLASFTPTVRCTVDSFYSDRNIFTHTFAPVTTSKLRLYVRDATWGGGAVKAFNDAIGYNIPHQINIREIEIYGPYANQTFNIHGQVTDASGKGIVGVPIALSGWNTATANTDANGSYIFSGLEAGQGYTVMPQSNQTLLTPNSAVTVHLYANAQQDFTAASTASFVKTDTTTRGNWIGTYGSQGCNVAGDAINYPTGMQVNISGQSLNYWTKTSDGISELQNATAPDSRSFQFFCSSWSPASFTIDMKMQDTQSHQLSLYFLEYWDMFTNALADKVEILDANTGNILDTRTISTFSGGSNGGGKYLVWNIKGHVQIRVTSIGWGAAVCSGVFFDAAH